MKAHPLLLVVFALGCGGNSSEAPAPATPAPAPASAPAPAAAAPVDGANGGATASAPTTAPAASPGATDAQADPLVGKPAPDFTATAQDGAKVHVAALKGKPVVVYFYPKDETAGCTKEACSFRDSWDAIGKTGAALVGVSADTLDSHRAFTAHYKLPFLLVSDPDGAIAKMYGVPFEGRHKRQTIVIGRDGKVEHVYRSVDVTTHAKEIQADLDHLPAGT
jgi:peroxiredoxin Q/BCP